MKSKPYDEDELTIDIADGKLPMTQVARKHGLTNIHSRREKCEFSRRFFTISFSFI